MIDKRLHLLVAVTFTSTSCAGCHGDSESAPCAMDAASCSPEKGCGSAAGDYIGATYDISKSHFAFGSTPIRADSAGLSYWTGDDGVVVIARCGKEVGLMNSGAPQVLLADWSSSQAALAEHVKNYFATMGVNPCQIQNAQVEGSSGGEIVSLSRVVGGIPVVESIAFARFNVNDQTTSEELYWPTLPSDTVSSAQGFSLKLSDPTSLANYKAILPTTAQGSGQVVIHHASCGLTSPLAPLQAQATYDVRSSDVPNMSSTILSFDISGSLVTTVW